MIERTVRAPQRVRVTRLEAGTGAGLPLGGPAGRPAERPATREIDEQTDVGEVYLTALLRSQLRPGLALLGVVLLGLGGLPVLFLLLPEVAGYRVGPVTVAWLLLGVAVFPALFAAAWWHVRTAERLEHDFTEMLRRR